MNFLLDTHLLLWAAGKPDQLSSEARELLLDLSNELWFSPASLWEITIKRSLNRADFRVDTRRLWRMLLSHGYRQLTISSEHVIAVGDLVPLHNDPFDRVLIAQARVEAITLLTADSVVASYGEGVRKI